jgi:hypothetical protein
MMPATKGSGVLRFAGFARRRLARRDDLLAQLVAEHERRLNDQDEAWTAWREANGMVTGRARLRMVKGGSDA